MKYIKELIYNYQRKREIKKIVRFLDNIKQSTRIVNYKITDTYFHLYIGGYTKNMYDIEYYTLDGMIEDVCHYLMDRRISIKKEFFKGI